MEEIKELNKLVRSLLDENDSLRAEIAELLLRIEALEA